MKPTLKNILALLLVPTLCLALYLVPYHAISFSRADASVRVFGLKFRSHPEIEKLYAHFYTPLLWREARALPRFQVEGTVLKLNSISQRISIERHGELPIGVLFDDRDRLFIEGLNVGDRVQATIDHIPEGLPGEFSYHIYSIQRAEDLPIDSQSAGKR